MRTKHVLTLALLSLILGLPTFAHAQQSTEDVSATRIGNALTGVVASDLAMTRQAQTAPAVPEGPEARPTPEQADTFEDKILALIRKVGVHGNMSVRHPTDNDVTRGVTFGPSIGLSPGRTNGWKYPVALSMFSEDLHSPSGAHFGTVRTVALMAGIGYGWHFGDLSVGPQFEVGYTFNHSSLEDDAPQAFAVPGGVAMDVSNAWMVRPEFKAEYELTPKFSVRASLDYVRLRPDVTVMTPVGAVPNTWDLSNVHANVGVGFYPFRK